MQDSQAWKQWNAEEWNRQLLLFCFVKDSQAEAWQGIRASEDDLPVLTGDDEAAGTEQAEALLRAIKIQARVQPGSFTPASLMADQVNRFRPASPGLPPFFAFLWVTCLLAHGFPDPQMEGRFHMRFNAVFSAAQARYLRFLPQGWEKLSLWLAHDASFEGAPHRQLQLRPVPLNASRIGHSWTLSFPRLGDRRLLHEHLRLDQQRGHRIDPWSPSLISRLLQVRGFSHDFRTELEQHAKDLRQTTDLDSWFTGFLLAEIDQLFRDFDGSGTSAGGSSFGPLLLKSHGQATGVLLMADGLPAEAITAFAREPGRRWGVPHTDLLLPLHPDDPTFAAYDAGSMAIDRQASPFRSLQPLVQKGLLLFRRDQELDALRLVLGDPSGAISHALVGNEHATAFQEQFGGELLPSDEEDWQCFRGFTASAGQLRSFPTSLANANRTARPQLIPVGGERLERSFLATGLGLPDVNVHGPHTPRALVLLSPENRSIDYEPALLPPVQGADGEHHPFRWTPKQRGRSIASFQTGEARLVAFFDEEASIECRIELDRVSPRPQFQRGDPLHRREDWGQLLGPTWLDQPLPSDEPRPPSEQAMSKARSRLNDGQNSCNPRIEEQMLEALCATFQRRNQMRDSEFQALFRRLGSMSTQRHFFEKDVLRAWVEGGWLDQGLSLRRGQWRLQPVQPRLVILAEGQLQLVGLLPAIGLVHVLAHAFDLGLKAEMVPPACPQLPRGWRFRGDAWAALAVCTGLPLVNLESWVPDPKPISWVVEPLECDRTDWSSSPHHTIRPRRICGIRKGEHRHPGNRLSDHEMAKPHTTIDEEQGLNGRYRWHYVDQHHDRFSSCHRNRVALHALNDDTNGLWPFGASTKKNTILRLYDADAYLPLPIGRWAALMGAAMPGPDLPREIQRHTYRYHFDPATLSSFRNDGNFPLTTGNS